MIKILQLAAVEQLLLRRENQTLKSGSQAPNDCCIAIRSMVKLLEVCAAPLRPLRH